MATGTITLVSPITGNGTNVGLLMSDLMNLAANVNPNISSAPYVSVQPTGEIANQPHGAINFTCTIYSEISASYQWQVSSNNGSTWSNASGGVYGNATTVHLSISNVNTLAGNWYRCQAVSALGTVNTKPGILSVITTEASNCSVTHPAAAAFSIAVTGQSNTAYQWYSNSGVLASAGVYSNVTTNTLNISNSQGLNGFTFWCVVSNPNSPSNNSNVVTLTVA